MLTAATVGLKDKCNSSLAQGQSIDNLIQNQLAGDGSEPLTLICGAKSDQVNEVLSYRGPLDLRGAERNPYSAYSNLFGVSTLAPTEQMLMRARRQSVNDLVRAEMQSLLGAQGSLQDGPYASRPTLHLDPRARDWRQLRRRILGRRRATRGRREQPRGRHAD